MNTVSNCWLLKRKKKQTFWVLHWVHVLCARCPLAWHWSWNFIHKVGNYEKFSWVLPIFFPRKGVWSKPWHFSIKHFFFLIPWDSQAFETIVQFSIKHYPSELFIKLQETANSGEQIFLMSPSPGGLFWSCPLLRLAADMPGACWLQCPVSS